MKYCVLMVLSVEYRRGAYWHQVELIRSLDLDFVPMGDKLHFHFSGHGKDVDGNEVEYSLIQTIFRPESKAVTCRFMFFGAPKFESREAALDWAQARGWEERK